MRCKEQGLQLVESSKDFMVSTLHIYYSVSTGKDHESVASIVTSAVGTSDNVAPDELCFPVLSK